MFLSKLNMAMHFGNLAFIRGIVYYKLSPYEQKPLAGAFKYGLPNLLPRTTATMYAWLPPLIIGCFIYKSVEDAYYWRGRKDPKDYVDEVDPNPEIEPIEEPVKTKKC